MTKTALLLLVCIFGLLGFQRVSAKEIRVSETWTKETPNLIFSEPVNIISGATLTIEKGTIVKFTKSGSESNPAGIFVENGNLVVNGTQEDNVKFTSDEDDSGFVIQIYNSPVRSFLRWVEISKAGCARSGGGELPPMSMFIKNIFNSTVYADELEFRSHQTCIALDIEGGNVHIENSIFRNNYSTNLYVGDEVYSDPDDYKIYRANVEVINSNFYDEDAYISEIDCWVDDPNTGDYYWSSTCRKRVYLKNNWLEKGVDSCEYSQTCYVESEREKELIADPVIVIPGIMGCSNSLSGWQLDPITHTYDNLMAGLEQNGYIPDQNLFAFVYDWRKDNQLSAQYLQTKVEAVIATTKVSKVNLVAHSMGGLIARAYIEEAVDQTKYPVEYDNTVEKLITLGTPQRGAPKAYLQWEAGEGFFSAKEKVMKYHFTEEAEHAGYDDLYEYIRERVISVGQLLPDYDYLKDAAGEMRDYPGDYPQNTFLEKLNRSDNVAKLGKVTVANILGYSDMDNTISAIKVGRISMSDDSIWAHGKPENFDDIESSQGLEYASGDGTVPKFSALAIDADRTIPRNFTHQALPDEAQCDVFSELTGKTVCVKDTSWHMTSILLINIFSPIDVQIIAPDGVHWAGKNIKNLGEGNKIEGAYYTGYAGVENEFITIPNPQDGEYLVVKEGTGDGAYRVEVTKISEDASGVTQESAAKISGTTVLGDVAEKAVEIEAGKVIGEDGDTEVPKIELQNPQEGKKFLNNKPLKIKYSLSDNKSLVDKISAEIHWDNVILAKSEIDLRLQKTGNHTLKIVAKDEAGNVGTVERSVEVITSAEALLQNVDYYFKQKMIKTQAERNLLSSHFLSIKLSEDVLQGLKNCPYVFSNKIRLLLIQALEKKIRSEITLLENHLRTVALSKIDFKAKGLLLSGLAYLKK
ncbi:MAG: alpha/beta hydrolase [Candidatus Moraniibacteriota bacterium]